MNCKYNPDAECWSVYKYCACMKDPKIYCSKNPHRFEDKKITEGQIKFLMNRGYSKEEVEKMSFLEAYNLIDSIKPQKFKRLY